MTYRNKTQVERGARDEATKKPTDTANIGDRPTMGADANPGPTPAPTPGPNPAPGTGSPNEDPGPNPGPGPDAAAAETWEQTTGYSGTLRAWAVSLAMVASFLLAAGGMTFGPRSLLWIGVGLFCALGVYSLAAHAWTDHVRDHHQHSHDI